MKRKFALLRMLVLVGCLPLIVRNTGVVMVSAQSGSCDGPLVSCRNFATNQTTPNCPSGCNAGTYATYALLDNNQGFWSAYENTATQCQPSGCQPVAYCQPFINCKALPCCLA